MRDVIERGLASRLDSNLVRELLEAHAEAKRNFYLGGLRLSEVEGGRFCEAAFRLLEHTSFGSCAPLGAKLNTERIIERLRNIPAGSQPDAVRLHIPRALRLVYDIRNSRDAAHLADGIDPNLQDATLVVAVIDWTVAEFVRLFHNVSADEAGNLVDELVTRVAPVVQQFGDDLKVLKPSLGASDHCLVLLYQRGESGATFQMLNEWVRPRMRDNLKRTLNAMVNEKDWAHLHGGRYQITRLGQREVERRRLVDPAV